MEKRNWRSATFSVASKHRNVWLEELGKKEFNQKDLDKYTKSINKALRRKTFIFRIKFSIYKYLCNITEKLLKSLINKLRNHPQALRRILRIKE